MGFQNLFGADSRLKARDYSYLGRTVKQSEEEEKKKRIAICETEKLRPIEIILTIDSEISEGVYLSVHPARNRRNLRQNSAKATISHQWDFSRS